MLNEIEQLLIDYLLTSKVTQGNGMLISLILKEESQQLAMCQFLSQKSRSYRPGDYGDG